MYVCLYVSHCWCVSASASAARDEAQAHFPRVLMVAEKPSVAKLIATHLSGNRFSTRRGTGHSCQFAHGTTIQMVFIFVVGIAVGYGFREKRRRKASFYVQVQKHSFENFLFRDVENC